MLTFFEYLRQRAYESIIAGVQDALGSLENESYSAELTEAARNSDQVGTLKLDREATPPASSPEQGNVAQATQSTELPAPRRRGRPPKAKRLS